MPPTLAFLLSCCLANTWNWNCWCPSNHPESWNDLKYGNHMAGTDRKKKKNLGQCSLSRAKILIYSLQLCTCLVEKINSCLSHYHLILKLILPINYLDVSNLLTPLSMIWRYNKGNITRVREGVKKSTRGFPGSSVGKEFTCEAGDLSSIPGLGRSTGEGNGYPLQYSTLENTVREVSKSQTRLSDFHFHLRNIN